VYRAGQGGPHVFDQVLTDFFHSPDVFSQYSRGKNSGPRGSCFANFFFRKLDFDTHTYRFFLNSLSMQICSLDVYLSSDIISNVLLSR